MPEIKNSEYINVCRYKFLKRKLQYFYAQKSIFYDYFKKKVLDYGNERGLLEKTEHYELIEIYSKLYSSDKNISKLQQSDENIKELLYFQNILILEFVLNEIVNNKFNKQAIISNSFPKNFYVLNNVKLFYKFTTDCYYEIYIYLLQLVSCDHLELKEKNEKSFYKYDKYLNNSFERTQDIFIRKNFKLERFMDILYEKLSINFDEIIEESMDKLENIEDAFFSYFTKTKINDDKDTNINLEQKINTFKNHTHFFSFFEELDLDTVEDDEKEKKDENEKIIFPLFVISLRNAVIRSCVIESIKDKNDLKKAKRALEKFIKDENESLKDRTEAYIFLTILSNRDIRFKNLHMVFLCHYLSLSCGQTERFIKTKIYLEREDALFNIQDVPMDVKAVRKFYYLLDKTYFENPNIKDFLELYAEKIDPKQFNFNLHEDLKKLLEI